MKKYLKKIFAAWREGRPLLPWRARIDRQIRGFESRLTRRIEISESKFNHFQDSLIDFGETLEERSRKSENRVLETERVAYNALSRVKELERRLGELEYPDYPTVTAEGPIGPHRDEDEAQ